MLDLSIIKPFSSVSIVDFEQVNVSWVYDIGEMSEVLKLAKLFLMTPAVHATREQSFYTEKQPFLETPQTGIS